MVSPYVLSGTGESSVLCVGTFGSMVNGDHSKTAIQVIGIFKQEGKTSLSVVLQAKEGFIEW
jgi:hypothetical protein